MSTTARLALVALVGGGTVGILCGYGLRFADRLRSTAQFVELLGESRRVSA